MERNDEQDDNRQGVMFAVIAAIVGSILFSCKGILTKAGMAHGATALGMLSLRMVYAAPVYAAVLLWSLRRNPIPTKHVAQAAGLGLLGCYLSPTLNFYGLGMVSASLERVLIHACPALIILVAWFYGREKLSRFTLVALAVCYAGVTLSCLGRDGGHASANPVGVASILVGCIVYAFFVVASVGMQRKMGTFAFTSSAMLASSLACSVQNVVCGSTAFMLHPPREIVPIGIALALLCTVAPAYLTTYGFRVLGASKSAVYSMVGPLLTPVLAMLVLGERMSAPQVGGFALVFTGGILLSRRGA